MHLSPMSKYPQYLYILTFSPIPSPNFIETINYYLISLFLSFLACKLYKKLTIRLPPGPRPWPIIGNLYDIKAVSFRSFTKWSQSYGPIISVWFGSNLNVVVSNAELAREVLKENDQQLAHRYRSRSVAKFSKDGKDLLWADYGPHYVKVRTLCTVELFSPKRLEALRPIREDEATAMVESIFKDCTNPENKDRSLVLKKYLEVMAFNNITRLAFGKRFDKKDGVMNEQGSECLAIAENMLNLGASLVISEHIPWLRWMFQLGKEAFANHEARRDKLTKQIMEEQFVARQKRGGASKQDFLDALLTLQKGYDISDDTILGILWDMMIAGVDTTTTTVEWAMAELIKNPRILQKAQDELDRVVGLNRVMTEWDFSNLPYLRCIAKESLRLHPPTPLLFPHKANTHVKIGGYDIPKGSNVHVNIWAIARDPAIWKSPLEFRPERFMEDDVDTKGHDFRLLPFGAGRRGCPGAQLGINLVTSMLGHLLHQFDWALADGLKPEDMDMEESSGLVAHMQTPLEVVATPRLPEHLYRRVAVDM